MLSIFFLILLIETKTISDNLIVSSETSYSLAIKTFKFGANLHIWLYHCLISPKGTIIKVLSSYLGLCDKIKAIVITVFPNPISSASIPPLHFFITFYFQTIKD